MDEVKKWYEDVPYGEVKKIISANIKEMSQSFIAVGYYLKYVRDNALYKEDGYNTIWEFAEDLYGIKASTASRWMSMNDKFSKDGNSPLIADKYREFGKSQLQEMLSIPEEDYKMIQPDMTKEEVRELANFTKENQNSPNALLNWQQTEDEALENAVLEFFRVRKESLNDLYASEAYAQNDLQGMKEIVLRRKKKTFKTSDNDVFMVLYAEQVYIKACNGEQYDIEWPQFFDIMRSIFDTSAAGNETWENYFEPKESDEQIPGQDNILNHPEYVPEGELHKKKFPSCVYMTGEECVSEECDGCWKKEEHKRQEKERTELTEEEAVQAFAENEPNRLKEILKICTETKAADRARMVQKHIAPYGFSGVAHGDYDSMYYTLSQGVRIKYGEKKLFTTYQKFVTAIMKKYGSELENTVIPAVAPAQKKCIHRPEYTCTLTNVQMAMEGDGEDCSNKCCWNCQKHGLCGYECNSSAHRPVKETIAEETERCENAAEIEENAAEIAALPEAWPSDLHDIPVPTMWEINEILREAEKELEAYLECEGIPERTILKKRLVVGGLRLIRNLTEDVQEEDS